MLAALHGAAGGWDELAIAAAALIVLWVAVKLAGRKAVTDDEDDEPLEADPLEAASAEPDQPGPAPSTSTRLG